MDRAYSTGNKHNVKFFVGKEIEKTPAYGLKTLFVVGIQDVNKIKQLCKEHDCKHIYLGANQSFEMTGAFMAFCITVLKTGILTTIDFDVKYVDDFVDGGLASYENCIPQVSVKVPYVNKLGPNATIKIDDIGFNKTNTGVWCHKLVDLRSEKTFTGWQEYRNDQIIE